MTVSQNPLNPSEEYAKCRICGMSQLDGGCEHGEKCAEIGQKLEMEEVYFREITDLLDSRPDNRPFNLGMAGFEMLDMLNVGLAVVNAGRVLLTNWTADQILAAADGLTVTTRGILRGPKGCALNALIEQTSKAALDENLELSSAALTIPRPSGKRPLILLVRSARNVSWEADPAGAPVLLFILDPEVSVEVGMNELRELYGFTPAEARMANLLMEGKSLETCCHQLGIGRSTARTHLQNLFKKAGVRRQSELVSLLFKTIGLVRTRGSIPRLLRMGLHDTRSDGRAKESRSRFC